MAPSSISTSTHRAYNRTAPQARIPQVSRIRPSNQGQSYLRNDLTMAWQVPRCRRKAPDRTHPATSASQANKEDSSFPMRPHHTRTCNNSQAPAMLLRRLQCKTSNSDHPPNRSECRTRHQVLSQASSRATLATKCRQVRSRTRVSPRAWHSRTRGEASVNNME